MISTSPHPNHAPWHMPVFLALLITTILALHTYHFAGHDYRQDEAWHVHYVLVLNSPADIIQKQLNDFHPPGWLLVLNAWVDAFGHVENITRFMSTLFTAVGLALLYRLAKDLFDGTVGWLAVFIMGTLAFTMFFIHETRPYAMLFAGTVAMQLFFLRWLKHRNFLYALLYVLCGIVMLYSHYYSAYIVITQAIFMVLFLRWNRQMYLRAFGLFAAVGLSFIGWILPLLNTILVITGGGIGYSLGNDWNALVLLHNQMQIRPYPIGQWLLLFGVLAAPGKDAGNDAMFRTPAWRKWYAILMPVTTLAISFWLENYVANVTPRNLTPVVPGLALWAAYALSRFPPAARMAAVFLISIPAVSQFEVFVTNGPYNDVTRFIAENYQPGDPIVLESDSAWMQTPLDYYLMERLPARSENIFHIILPGQQVTLNAFAVYPVYLATGEDEAALASFEQFITTSERLWLIQTSAPKFADVFNRLIDNYYTLFRQREWTRPAEVNEYGVFPSHVVKEYRRTPVDLRPWYSFGDVFSLQAWKLLQSVQVRPCQVLTLQSWWRAEKRPGINYSMTFVLADAAGQGVTRTDGQPSDIPTVLWKPGRLYVDERSLVIPCDITPGQYNLLAGLYNPDTVEGLPIKHPDGSPGAGYLTTVYVE